MIAEIKALVNPEMKYLKKIAFSRYLICKIRSFDKCWKFPWHAGTYKPHDFQLLTTQKNSESDDKSDD